MRSESWKPVIGFEGKYVVSDLGRVKSLHKRNPEYFLNPRIDRAGYHTVRLSSNGRTVSYFVHRLVGMHFIPNPLNKPQVNHISGDKLDNCVSNLEWVTHSENMIHAYRIGAISNSKRFVGLTVIDKCNNVIYPSIRAAVEATPFSYSELKRKIHGHTKNDTCLELAA